MLHIAAWPVLDGYEVVIVDGSLAATPEDAHRRVLGLRGARCSWDDWILGYMVFDALQCTRKVKRDPGHETFIDGWLGGPT